MEHDRDPQPDRDVRAYLIAMLIVLVLVAMVVLHLTGILGPGSH